MGMMGFEYDKLAILNGGLIHIVHKVFGDVQWKMESLYFKTKSEALDAIIDVVNGPRDENLSELSYLTYDAQGNVKTFLKIYNKEGRYETRFFPYDYSIKITDRMDRMLKTLYADKCSRVTIQSIFEEGLETKYVEKFSRDPIEDDKFKPCPICDGSLLWRNVRFFDDEGNMYDHVSDQFVDRVVIECDCGYSFSEDVLNLYDELEDLEEGGKWERNFIALANRRKGME